jgi:hypothetical protein
LKLLTASLGPLSEETKILVPQFELNADLLQAIKYAVLNKRTMRGLDQISDSLKKEQKGLDQMKQKNDFVPRISRLIITSNDGSPRFYRNAERIMKNYKSRVFGCTLTIDSSQVGEAIFGPDKATKILMIDHKESVSQVLLSLVKN